MTMPTATDSYWADSGESPPWRKQLKSIDDPIAEHRFTYRNAEGKRATCRVVMGHPHPAPKGYGGEWYCPVLISGFTVGIQPVPGMGPLSAVLNAASMIRGVLDENVFYPGIKFPWNHFDWNSKEGAKLKRDLEKFRVANELAETREKARRKRNAKRAPRKAKAKQASTKTTARKRRRTT
jgi:hypothetical protein